MGGKVFDQKTIFTEFGLTTFMSHHPAKKIPTHLPNITFPYLYKNLEKNNK